MAARAAPEASVVVRDAECDAVTGTEGLAREHVEDRALGNDAAVCDASAWGAAGRDLFEVVGDDHHWWRAGVGEQRREVAEHLLAGADVESGGGLVEEQELGLAHQGAGQERALGLASRQGGEGVVGELGDTEPFQQRAGPRSVGVVVGVPPRRSVPSARGHHHFQRVHRRFEARRDRGRRNSDARSHRPHVTVPELLAQHAYASRRRMLVQRRDAQQRGLARAVRTDDHPAFAVAHAPGDVSEHIRRAVAVVVQRDVVDVDSERSGHEGHKYPLRVATIPDKPGLEGLEATWGQRWEADGTYRFDRTRPRSEVFSIDTPPPTVSGSLHVGSACSYTHTDTVARYQRMRGRAVFYPMGWDDNGLPTERRVQNYFGVRCDPARQYDEDDFEIPARAGNLPSGHRSVAISRKRFLELCERLVAEDEVKFESLWRALGLSVDWSYTYTTIGEGARRTSQRAFLRNLARDEAYQADAPTLWDVDDQTAIAQAEIEDKETPGAYHRLAFHRSDGSGGGGGGGNSPSGASRRRAGVET